MSLSPNWTGTPRCTPITISTANQNLSGAGTITTVFVAGQAGSRIDELVVQAAGQTTTGMVRLYINDGTTNNLYKEIDVTAAIPGYNTKAFRYDWDLRGTPIILQSGLSLGASTHNPEAFVVTPIAGDF